MSLKEQILSRIHLVVWAAGLMCFAILFKIFQLQLVEYDRWAAFQSRRIKTEKAVFADRGNILASDHRVLASSVPDFKMRLDFRSGGFNDELFHENVDELAKALASYFKDRSAASYTAYLKRGYKSQSRAFPVVPYYVNYIDLDTVSQFPFLRESRRKTGFYTERRVKRIMPFGQLSRRTIGQLDSDAGDGVYGVEQAYNEELKGKEGVVTRKRISGKTVWEPKQKPVEGNDIVTTLDVTLQDVAQSALEKQLRKHGAHHGCAVLMEVETGHILAMANLTLSGEQYRELYNYAVGELSEPGSTFKLVSFVVALEDGVVDLDKEVDTGTGVKRFYGARMTDSHGNGVISYRRVFEVSSNVGTSALIDSVYRKNPQRFVDQVNELGINQPTGVDIAGEPQPFITSPDKKTWSGLSLPWMSIGYETKFTPLQILNFYNAIANDGKMVKPRLVKEIYNHGEKVKEFRTDVIKSSICSDYTVKMARKLMEGVVDSGTAMNLKEAHLKIAGKTGTAQIAQGTEGYRKSRKTYKASFCGYFPAEDPKYSCIVVVTNPTKGGYYGNQVAGTVFREIADKVYAINPSLTLDKKEEETDDDKDVYKFPVSMDGSYAQLKQVYKFLDVDYEEVDDSLEWVRITTKPDSVGLKPLTHRYSLLPNVVGMGAMDAVYLLERSGVQVTVSGKGMVKRQSVMPGVRIRPGIKVVLTLG